MKVSKRYFRLVYDDEPPGLWSSRSSQLEVTKLLAAFEKAGITVEEIEAEEAKRIRQQQRNADAKRVTDE